MPTFVPAVFNLAFEALVQGFDLILDRALARDIPHDYRTTAVYARYRNRNQDPRIIAAAAPTLRTLHRLAEFERSERIELVEVRVVRDDQIGERLSDRGLGRVLKQRLRAAVPGLDDAVGVQGDNRIVRLFDDSRKT